MKLLQFLIGMIVFMGCSGNFDEIQYRAELERKRSEKNAFFKINPHSPLPDTIRNEFSGLNYYPIDPRYRFELKIIKEKEPDTLIMATNTGEERPAVKYGFFTFSLEGKKYNISVFKFLDSPNEGHLFIPFMDQSNGRETYGAGRYLDLEENQTGRFVLDFNRAYNPYCAYNSIYSCPIPPSGNRLNTSVRAGEKIFILK